MNLKKTKASEFSNVASLIGQPARAAMLWRLLEGKALTAMELATCTDISAQSASMHLGKLVTAKLLVVVSQGRHKYYRLASSEVAYVLEAISNLVPADHLVTEEETSLNHLDIKYCRTCYDHLAGKVGVALTDQLMRRKVITNADQNFEVTSNGEKWLETIDISVIDLRKQRRAFAKKCLDWSERRYHISGSLGAALLERMIDMKWLRKIPDSRRVLVTPIGQQKMYTTLGLAL